MIGDTVYRTSGTTKGPVRATCMITPPDTVYNSSVNCATAAYMDDEPGDSGAPVYYWSGVLQPGWRFPEGLAFASGWLKYSPIRSEHVMLYNDWDQLEGELGVTMDPLHP
jgi:hypothetical protein